MFTKNLKTILFTGLMLASVSFISCSDDDTPVVEQPKNIVELASATPDLSSLVAAVQKAGLVDVLSADGALTVFAPTNAAFQALLDSNNDWNSLDDIPTDVLMNVLKFHVLGQKVTSGDLSDSYVNTLGVGPNDESLSLQIETTGAIEFNGDAKPVTVNIEASNGIIHIIDKVMLPPNVVSTAINNSNFSTLVAALTDSRHTTDFVSVLNGDGPFTIFAPTNEAFQALLDSNADWNGLADIPIETLDAVLKYHVVNAANVQSKQLQNNQEITMLSTGKVTVDLTNGAKLKTSSDQTVSITATDVQGSNGVIHVVNTVLLPSM
ncbi:fasciclin domain-containing protein [Tenacibaculum xiamenense]|uniref:fasciclin domain-containing protein n=1 Tax=Tenacibaculum xiamenense TaxID=1261553 RepID=UPI00389600C7